MVDDQKTNSVIVQRSTQAETDEPGQQGLDEQRRLRGERILDVAAELVLRWGYKRVTIEEIAKRAGIGKGTIYLHWRSREALFSAMFLRESVVVLDILLARLDEDVAAVLPHRFLPMIFLESMRRPLVAGLLTRNTELLGALVEQLAEPSEDTAAGAAREYLRLLREHGLVRTDLDLDRQLYLYVATIDGYCLVQPWLPRSLNPPLEVKADALAHAVRAIFEPAGPPDPDTLAAVAPRLRELYREIRDEYAAALHGGPVTE